MIDQFLLYIYVIENDQKKYCILFVKMNLLVQRYFSKSKPKLKFNYQKDYYEILGIQKRASNQAIRLQYLKMVKLHHPDAQRENLEHNIQTEKSISPQNNNKDNAKTDNTKVSSSQKFIEIQQAYQILSDSQLRKEYDSQTYPYSETLHSSQKNESYNQSKRVNDNVKHKSEQQRNYNYKKWEQQYEQQMADTLEYERIIAQKRKKFYANANKINAERQRQKYGEKFHGSEEQLQKIRNLCKDTNPLWMNYCSLKQRLSQEQKNSQEKNQINFIKQLGLDSVKSYMLQLKQKFKKK